MMAVDLTPRFRRLNSQTRSFRENIQHGKIQVLTLNKFRLAELSIQIQPRGHNCMINAHKSSQITLMPWYYYLITLQSFDEQTLKRVKLINYTKST